MRSEHEKIRNWQTQYEKATETQRLSLLSELASGVVNDEQNALALLADCEITRVLLEHIISYPDDHLPRLRTLLLGNALKLARRGDAKVRELIVAYTYSDFIRIAHKRRRGQSWLTGTLSLVQDAQMRLAERWDDFWNLPDLSDDPDELVRKYFARSTVQIHNAIVDHYRRIAGRKGPLSDEGPNALPSDKQPKTGPVHKKLDITRPAGHLPNDLIDEPISDPFKWEELHKAIADLPESQKVVVMRRFYNDLTFEEISEQLGISAARARGLHRLAIRSLRDRFGNKFFE